MSNLDQRSDPTMKSAMVGLATCLLMVSMQICAEPTVYVERVPDSGLQPRMTNDREGGVHLVYFRPDGSNPLGRTTGALHYRTRVPHGSWSASRRISDTFTHGDPIGKAAIAVDADKQLHVVWLTTNPLGYWYSRSLTDGSGFEQPRPIVTEHLRGVEAEASIAVAATTVSIVWHAGRLSDESRRRVLRVTSTDGGTSFGDEIVVSKPSLGACGCCGLASTFASDGSFVIAYRSAIDNTGRHMQLLSNRGGDKWATRSVGDWNVGTCPVSSNTISDNWLVFETAGKIQRLDVRAPSVVEGLTDAETRQKHPDFAVGAGGNQLIVWGEAPGYYSGGTLTMALIDNANRRLDVEHDPGRMIPDFSVAAVSSLGEDFLVLY